MQLTHFSRGALEQITHDSLDYRTDIYSLGCLLYVIYCGGVPYPDGNIFYHHQHPPSPSSGPRLSASSVPLSMCCVLHQCTAKDRDRRYQRAGGVARECAYCYPKTSTETRVVDTLQAPLPTYIGQFLTPSPKKNAVIHKSRSVPHAGFFYSTDTAVAQYLGALPLTPHHMSV